MNNDILNIVIAVAGAYLIGSFPTAYIVAHLRKGIDIRNVGTHNMGAMNVTYTLGLAWGIPVLLIDIAKGAGAIVLAQWLGVSFTMQLLAGGIAVIGHIFPVFLKFRGGKGGAVCIGVFAYLMPWAIPIGLGIFFILLIFSRFPTFSYSIALCCAPFVAWLIYHSGVLTVFSIIILLLLLARYLPRLKEMRSAGGSWQRVFLRKNIKDRF